MGSRLDISSMRIAADLSCCMIVYACYVNQIIPLSWYWSPLIDTDWYWEEHRCIQDTAVHLCTMRPGTSHQPLWAGGWNFEKINHVTLLKKNIDPVGNNTTLIQVMAWCWTGNKSCPLYWACYYLSMLGLKLNHVSKSGHWSVPSHYLNQWWNIVNWSPRIKLQLKFSRSSHIFIQENAFENVIWEIAAFCPGGDELREILLAICKYSEIIFSWKNFKNKMCQTLFSMLRSTDGQSL